MFSHHSNFVKVVYCGMDSEPTLDLSNFSKLILNTLLWINFQQFELKEIFRSSFCCYRGLDWGGDVLLIRLLQQIINPLSYHCYICVKCIFILLPISDNSAFSSICKRQTNVFQLCLLHKATSICMMVQGIRFVKYIELLTDILTDWWRP